jgi:hypothetical protein
MSGAKDTRAHADARQGRLAALVIAGAGLLWIAAQWAGGFYGWPARFVFLFDFAALAAFVFALSIAWRLWRRRQN